MASNYWVKLHHAILDDPRFAEVSTRAAWRWVLCFAYAGELHKNGLLNTTRVLAWRLRIPENELASDLDAMRDAGLLTQDDVGIWAVVGFMESQAPETDARRKRAQRKREKRAKWSLTNPQKQPNGNGASDRVTVGVTNRDIDKNKEEDERRGRQKTSPENPRRYLDGLDD